MKFLHYLTCGGAGAILGHFTFEVLGNAFNAARYVVGGYPNAGMPTLYLGALIVGAVVFSIVNEY